MLDRAGEKYAIIYNIVDAKFQMYVILTSAGVVSVKVLDNESQEEYILVHTPCASGAFITAVIQVCEETLNIIVAEVVFKNEQAKRSIAYTDKTYQTQLEFLWKNSPTMRFSDARIVENGM